MLKDNMMSPRNETEVLNDKGSSAMLIGDSTYLERRSKSALEHLPPTDSNNQVKMSTFTAGKIQKIMDGEDSKSHSSSMRAIGNFDATTTHRTRNVD